MHLLHNYWRGGTLSERDIDDLLAPLADAAPEA